MVRKQKKKNEKKSSEPKMAIGIYQSDVKSFLEKFKADVAGKVKKYRKFAQESRKKKNL